MIVVSPERRHFARPARSPRTSRAQRRYYKAVNQFPASPPHLPETIETIHDHPRGSIRRMTGSPRRSVTRRLGRPPVVTSADTRGRIIDNARRVFNEVGYEGATFSTIANRADLTRPALNYHFKNKRELYRAVVDHTDALVVAVGIQRGREAATLFGQLMAFVRVAAQVDDEDRSAAAFLVTSLLSRHRPQHSEESEHHATKDTRKFVQWAVNGTVERGELRTDIEAGLLVESRLAITWGMIFYIVFLGSKAESGVIIDRFTNLVTRHRGRTITPALNNAAPSRFDRRNKLPRNTSSFSLRFGDPVIHHHRPTTKFGETECRSTTPLTRVIPDSNSRLRCACA
jgi:AcrR family transcriptional regulator